MNKEENIQKIQDQIDKVKEYIEYGMPYGEYLQLQLAFDDIVNLIQKQEKIINNIKFITYNNKPHITQEKLIEYFKKEVEDENTNR